MPPKKKKGYISNLRDAYSAAKEYGGWTEDAGKMIRSRTSDKNKMTKKQRDEAEAYLKSTQ